MKKVNPKMTKNEIKKLKRMYEACTKGPVPDVVVMLPMKELKKWWKKA